MPIRPQSEQGIQFLLVINVQVSPFVVEVVDFEARGLCKHEDVLGTVLWFPINGDLVTKTINVIMS